MDTQRTQNNGRSNRGRQITRQVQTRVIDRRAHERAAAIVEFQKWDREMIRQHGPNYHRAMRYTLH